MLRGQFFERPVGLTVKLDENQVPDLHHLGIIHIYQFGSRFLLPFCIGTQVYVYLGTGSAGTGISHLPKVIGFIKLQDMIICDTRFFFPEFNRFLIHGQTVFIIPFKNSGIQTVRLQSPLIYQQLPGPANSFTFKVIAERPVSQHFKHGMVIGIPTYLFKIIMLAAYPNATLAVDHTIVNFSIFFIAGLFS